MNIRIMHFSIGTHKKKPSDEKEIKTIRTKRMKISNSDFVKILQKPPKTDKKTLKSNSGGVDFCLYTPPHCLLYNFACWECKRQWRGETIFFPFDFFYFLGSSSKYWFSLACHPNLSISSSL